MGKQDEPTILFDSNFIMDSDVLEFVNENVRRAVTLHDKVGGVSLKFTHRYFKKRAEFMWKGILMVQIEYTAKTHDDFGAIMEFLRDLSDDNIDANVGSWIRIDELWKKAFQPSVRLAIKKEAQRLNRFDQYIEGILNLPLR